MSTWQARKEFLLLTESDEAALTLLQPLITRHADQLVDAFYHHLLLFPETRKLLTDDELVARLKTSQKHYLLSLVSGRYDSAYQEERIRIGEIHDRIGLTPQWYLGAYALYLNLIRSLIFDEFRGRPAQIQNSLAVLTKVVFLDIQLAIEAYIRKGLEHGEFANQQLALFSHQLEGAVNLQKHDLLEIQERLRETERIAELGVLASTMAHEIGTPLNVILGRAESLLPHVGDEKTRQYLETIVTQAERITKIVNQTLGFARKKPVERVPVDVRQIVQGIQEWIIERANRRRVLIETCEADMPLKVQANPNQMIQVLLNLVLNAIDAMPEGGTLRIFLGLDGEHVKLAISDTGSGIASRDLPKVFDPFFTTKEAGKGTGLGLAIVHNIVQEHGGSINVESEPGRGTTFSVLLPALSR